MLQEVQLELFEIEKNNGKVDLTSTFADNMKLPVHKWYRYTAGFSGPWVRELIYKENAQNVLDPFGGSGTVMLEGEFAGINTIGIEAHPYVYRIAKAKLSWHTDPKEFKDAAISLLKKAKTKIIEKSEYPKLIEKCYPLEILKKLEALKKAWFESKDKTVLKELNWFVITAILRTTSPVGTAQWQYIQPSKTKGKVIDVFRAFEAKVYEMAQDMQNMQRRYPDASKSKVFMEDARNMPSVPDNWADLVITSPPYANNYDYADATRLEMTFWGDIEGWGDLQEKVRKFLVTACTQHVTSLKEKADEILDSPLLTPIRDEIKEVYNELAETRLTKGGKKNYHLMIIAYFNDLSRVFQELRRVTKKNCKVCFVIGDSAPYGVYVPVERWLGELALYAGFNSYEFEKLRDRNIKWKNRKHRVPLHEGRLWING
ncbi:MAG: DNA modification methylase [bacterium]